MNAYLLAHVSALPMCAVLGGLLLASANRSPRRRADCQPRRGVVHGLAFPLLVIVVILLLVWLHEQKEKKQAFVFHGQPPTQRRDQPPQPPVPPAAPEPQLTDWSAVGMTMARSVETSVQAALGKAQAETAKHMDARQSDTAPAKVDPVQPTSGGRPAWVDATPGKRDGAYQVTAVSGPWSTDAECEKALDQELRRAVGRYLAEVDNDDFAMPNIPLSYIKSRVVTATYRDVIDSPSLGPMIQWFARLEFTPQVQHELQDQVRSQRVEGRLECLLGVGIGVFAALGFLFGVLKLDALTRGKYRWRLGLGTAVVWLGVFFVLTHNHYL